MSQRPLIYYAVIRAHGENWDDSLPLRRQRQWDEHAAFMDALTDDGFVILGGPLGEGKALLIVAAENEQEIAARLAADPWTPSGMLYTASVERWQILLDGRRRGVQRRSG